MNLKVKVESFLTSMLLQFDSPLKVNDSRVSVALFCSLIYSLKFAIMVFSHCFLWRESSTSSHLHLSMPPFTL